MKCVMCGHRMKVRHETRRHDLGLDAAVTLEDIEVAHCEHRMIDALDACSHFGPPIIPALLESSN